jgi:hypothetical protein
MAVVTELIACSNALVEVNVVIPGAACRRAVPGGEGARRGLIIRTHGHGFHRAVTSVP